MRRLALLRRLEDAFPYRPSELFVRWMDEDIRSSLGYTIQLDAQDLAVSFKKDDGTPLDPADPLVAGYWRNQKRKPNADTLEAFRTRAPRHKPGELPPDE